MDVSDISIIIHKREESAFHFVNPARKWDGFTMITEGIGRAVDGAGKSYALQKGDILFLHKGERYELHFPKGCAYITSAFALTVEQNLPFVYHLSDAGQQSVRRICEIWQARAWDSFDECRIRLLRFYLDLRRRLRNEEQDGIGRAVTFVHENFKRNFSGRELAQACGLSLSYLRAQFLRRMGCTVTEYRDRLRVEAAREMLESECFSVAQIAEELGYCDVYHFSKAFKRLTGQAPSLYNDMKFSDGQKSSFTAAKKRKKKKMVCTD